MRVPQAEPYNMAMALSDAFAEEPIVIQMLGLNEERLIINKAEATHILEVVPFYGHNVKSAYSDANTSILLWQGRHCIQIPEPTNPNITDNTPIITIPYAANAFEKLSLLDLWQVMMYNFVSSPSLEYKDMSFIYTDARLPLLELHKVAPSIVTRPLPKGIAMVSQAYLHEQIRAWHNKWGNAQLYSEINIGEYVYQFNASTYLPMHALPIWSHSIANDTASPKQGRDTGAIFQVQSLKYMDEYRKNQLAKAIAKYNGKVVLHGRFGKDERGLIHQYFPEKADSIIANLVDNSNTAESFFDSAKTLSKWSDSLIISDARYVRFGLCPNRLIEAACKNVRPCFATVGSDVVKHCDTYVNRLVEIVSSSYKDAQVQSLITDMQYDLLHNIRLLWTYE
jgi:hypothetical protein